jgi:hypothetical protein
MNKNILIKETINKVILEVEGNYPRVTVFLALYYLLLNK